MRLSIRISRGNVIGAVTMVSVCYLIWSSIDRGQYLSLVQRIPHFFANKFRHIHVEEGPKCYKVNKHDTYQICDKLPYTNMDCGSYSDSSKMYVVPNVVHFVWIGNRTLRLFDYLSLRAAAANQKPDMIKFHYADNEPQGDLWIRAKQEIPCLKLIKFKPSLIFQGNKVDTVVHQTDITRFQILLKEGGIYVDSDAMILRSMDPLRKYDFTMGRSIEVAFSSGVIISKANSSFLQAWAEIYRTYTKNDYFTFVSYRLHQSRPDLPIHVEEITMQRPNPGCDGQRCIYGDSFNISENYILHLHPTLGGMQAYTSITEKDLRLHDSTYGAGARAVLYGTQDLIFLSSEASQAHNRTKQKIIKRFPPIKLKSANTLPGL